MLAVADAPVVGRPYYQEGDKVSWETAWAEAEVARRFVHRLSELSRAERRPALAPVLDRDPYLSAWLNIEAALGSVPEADQARLPRLLAELDAQVERLDLLPSLREAARRATRALLARRWLGTQESLTFVYEPFESVIPLVSLGG
jgi:hypothetical protein